MRRIAVLVFSLVLTAAIRAAGPDDAYLDIYNEILQGDTFQQSGQPAEAIAKYVEARTSLKALQQASPAWNPEIVNYRLDYLSEQIQALQKPVTPPSNPVQPPQPVQPAPPVQPPQPAPPIKQPTPQAPTETDILREQVRSLSAVNAELQNKLKEALSVQPAAISPAELAKAAQNWEPKLAGNRADRIVPPWHSEHKTHHLAHSSLVLSSRNARLPSTTRMCLSL